MFFATACSVGIFLCSRWSYFCLPSLPEPSSNLSIYHINVQCVTWGWTEFLFREEVSKPWDLFFSVVWPKYYNCSQKHPEAGCRINWLTLNHWCHPERWKGLIPSKPQTRITALRMLWILSNKSCQLTVPSLLCLWVQTCSTTPCQLLLLHACSFTASLSLDVFV